jgi:transposase
MEIISGVERRRRWRIEDKLRILAEIDGGATLTDVARRYDVSRGLLWQWRDAQRQGRLTAERATFVPVRLVPELVEPGTVEGAADLPSMPRPAEGAAEGSRSVEIVLSDGTVLRVAEDIGLAALRRLLSALRG